jgi:hypothetical protein
LDSWVKGTTWGWIGTTPACSGVAWGKSQTHLLQPVPAHPRNLTGSDGRLRKDKRQKTNMQKAGVRWAGHSGGDTHQPSPSPGVYYIQCKQGGGATVLGDVTLWSSGTGGTCDRYSLRKGSCAAFCLTPFCSKGLCQSQPADYLTRLCLCQVLTGLSYSAPHTHPSTEPLLKPLGLSWWHEPLSPLPASWSPCEDRWAHFARGGFCCDACRRIF